MIKSKYDTKIYIYRKQIICQLYAGGKGEGEFKALLHAMSAYAEQIFISTRLD